MPANHVANATEIANYITEVYLNFTSDHPYPNWNDLPEVKIITLLWKIWTPVLLVFGNFGNIVTIVVMSRKQFSESTTATYFRALAGMVSLLNFIYIIYVLHNIYVGNILFNKSTE